MNPYKEAWLEEIQWWAAGAIARNDPFQENSTYAKQNTLKSSLGSAAIRTAAILAIADGPLPIGDAVAATGLAAVGLYLLITAYRDDDHA